LIEQLQKDALEHYSSHDFGKDIIPKVVAKQKVQAFRFCTPSAIINSDFEFPAKRITVNFVMGKIIIYQKSIIFAILTTLIKKPS
jgi:ADP-glucose pyrophosphorylase